jgi:hypothetical protein
MGSQWPPLTVALKDKQLPVRRFLDQRFPNLGDTQRQYRQQVGPIVVAESTVNPGTLGGAFDWMVRFLVNPRPDLQLARSGAGLAGVFGSQPLREATAELAELLGAPLSPTQGGRSVGDAPTMVYAGPLSATEVDPELLARGCWALAVLTEVFRAGLLPGSPILTLQGRQIRAENLLALAPEVALDQLARLRRAAEDTLLPALSGRRGSWALGPTFDGSAIMNADADLIAAGLLLEIKTSLGTKRKDGSRQAGLDGQTVLQLLGYTLLDFSDHFKISELGLYSARYAHLATWNLQQLLDELAGRSVDLAAERAAFKEILQSGPSPDATAAR